MGPSLTLGIDGISLRTTRALMKLPTGTHSIAPVSTILRSQILSISSNQYGLVMMLMCLQNGLYNSSPVATIRHVKTLRNGYKEILLEIIKFLRADFLP